MLKLKDMLERAKKENTATEKVLWESIAICDEALCLLAEQDQEKHDKLLRKVYVTLYGKHFCEEMARSIVSEMMHTDRHGAEHIGEHYSHTFVKEIKEKHSLDADCWDLYVALNATWHDFEALYSEWFSTPSDQHFVKTALAFWFEDEDYAKSDKIWNYFN